MIVILAYLVFLILFAGVFFGVFAERYVVMGRLSKTRGEQVPLAYTGKGRSELIESYRTECNFGEADFWYSYLNYCYTKGTVLMWGALCLMLLAVSF